MNIYVHEDMKKVRLFKRFGYDIVSARRRIVSRARLSGRILEVGTGKGHLTLALAQKSLRVISIDTDRNQQRVARAHLKEKSLEQYVTFRVMNAERLAFKNEFFDGVISVNFLHHARNPLKCVAEMLRVTKGILVLADLNKKGEAVMDTVHGLEGRSHPKSSVSFKEVRAFLERSGMVVKTYTSTCETALIARKGV